MKSSTIASGVYIVGVPIGNYQDITLRALETLKSVDLILCEDTRETKKLLDDFFINQNLISYVSSYNHAIKKATNFLQNKKSIAIVSDRGMPCISDPGAEFVQIFQQMHCSITVVPGVSALTTSFALTGLVGDFYFAGFFPKKPKDIILKVRELLVRSVHLIFFESSHRIYSTLKILTQLLDKRIIFICRELTKSYEEVLTGSAEELLAHKIQGEIVLIIPRS